MFVSRIHEVKNILLAIQIVKSLKCKAVFDIYGPIESKDYWDLCLKEMEHLSENIQINYCGLLPMDEVGKTFQNYDAFLFPTINENYGHVIAEAVSYTHLVAVYSTFLQRSYDQIVHDVCLQDLPVVFCIDRAGIVGADGELSLIHI